LGRKLALIIKTFLTDYESLTTHSDKAFVSHWLAISALQRQLVLLRNANFLSLYPTITPTKSVTASSVVAAARLASEQISSSMCPAAGTHAAAKTT